MLIDGENVKAGYSEKWRQAALWVVAANAFPRRMRWPSPVDAAARQRSVTFAPRGAAVGDRQSRRRLLLGALH
jgi:hypothetical protein